MDIVNIHIFITVKILFLNQKGYSKKIKSWTTRNGVVLVQIISKHRIAHNFGMVAFTGTRFCKTIIYPWWVKLTNVIAIYSSFVNYGYRVCQSSNNYHHRPYDHNQFGHYRGGHQFSERHPLECQNMYTVRNPDNALNSNPVCWDKQNENLHGGHQFPHGNYDSNESHSQWHNGSSRHPLENQNMYTVPNPDNTLNKYPGCCDDQNQYSPRAVENQNMVSVSGSNKKHFERRIIFLVFQSDRHEMLFSHSARSAPSELEVSLINKPLSITFEWHKNVWIFLINEKKLFTFPCWIWYLQTHLAGTKKKLFWRLVSVAFTEYSLVLI